MPPCHTRRTRLLRHDPPCRAPLPCSYVAFMTTPGSHNDTYAESYHRDFFKSEWVGCWRGVAGRGGRGSETAPPDPRRRGSQVYSCCRSAQLPLCLSTQLPFFPDARGTTSQPKPSPLPLPRNHPPADWAAGVPPEKCAGEEGHNTASIGGFVTLPPVILGAMRQGAEASAAAARRHLALTHQSQALGNYAQVRCAAGPGSTAAGGSPAERLSPSWQPASNRLHSRPLALLVPLLLPMLLCCCTAVPQVYSQLLVEVTNGRDLREAVRSAAKDVGVDLGEEPGPGHSSPFCSVLRGGGGGWGGTAGGWRWCASARMRGCCGWWGPEAGRATSRPAPACASTTCCHPVPQTLRCGTATPTRRWCTACTAPPATSQTPSPGAFSSWSVDFTLWQPGADVCGFFPRGRPRHTATVVPQPTHARQLAC